MALRSRRDVLADVLDPGTSFDAVVVELSKYDFDAENESVQLNAHQVIKVIKRYIAGELESDLVEKWANVIEGRDDIGIAELRRDQILSAIHKLANPVLEGALDHAMANQIILDLA